ncbi:AraC family transcriptional regulator [Agrobacterium rhizogenes]|uniref:Transcriptional regulator protein, AraC family n=1 Tax=Rhizobium rhizogenes (strain K84 / ATCC BAA-868) TaxID=311403 RepID=B9JM27_RHIR8|nr:MULTISPECIES: helix-turn-helix transcriptional regulator [Rhizobium]ACM28741.1 transcriptional regulator protein, AraC family [Rhizobium rhizogenes K84]OCJ18994.1 AraC family transcriptional regulator [Agrobacterium sp. B131/95]EJK88037.1 transcriptional regulator containing an amidase domain and an AraC-type DNA-binding HTH domain [Rhizobium sp. AP16]NTI43732.1 AraC family transcriptional regulator [Rhizobium rhizogenes]NTI63707.1 AraC family transcriptional regulator [Rhizobium rhizogenes
MQETARSNHVSRLQGATFDHMVETFTESFGPFEAWPVTRGRTFDWKADLWSNGTLSLIIGEYHSEWRAKAVPETQEWLSILLPLTGAIDVARGRNVIEGVPGQMLLVNNREAERFSVRGEPHRSQVLRLNWTAMAQKVADILEIPLSGALDLSPVVDLSTSSGQVIGGLGQVIILGIRDAGPLCHSPIAISNLTETLADMIVRSIPHRLSHHLDKKIHMIAPRHVHSAIEFMRANIDRPFTMQKVAEVAGVSIRSLEEGFRTFKGTTPAAFLRTMRLRAVREDLLDHSNRRSVQDICLKWGFFHFGRFSTVYRMTYGENPSDTRKRISRGFASFTPTLTNRLPS